MRVVRLVGYLAAIFSGALLTLDGANSIVSGTVGLMSVADIWELFGPYLANLVSAGKSSSWNLFQLQPALANQLQFPASIAMLGLTAAIFLIDTILRRLTAAISFALRSVILVGS